MENEDDMGDIEVRWTPGGYISISLGPYSDQTAYLTREQTEALILNLQILLSV